MSYEKQTWEPYNDELTEEQNIQIGAVVTAERMNYLETGLEKHDKNKTNPHQVTKEQIGLGNVSNVEQASKIDFNSHKNDKTNPHNITASQVGAYSKIESDNRYAKPSDITKEQAGLGDVDNFATATQEEAEAGLAKDKFMTPFLVFKAIAKWVQGKFVTPEDLLNKTYPIGSIYPSVSSVNPELLFGGTWERFAKGQVLVGVDETDADFAAGTIGGEKKHALKITGDKTTNEVGFTTPAREGITGYGLTQIGTFANRPGVVSDSSTTYTPAPHNNLQPYIAVYMWKRIA